MITARLSNGRRVIALVAGVLFVVGVFGSGAPAGADGPRSGGHGAARDGSAAPRGTGVALSRSDLQVTDKTTGTTTSYTSETVTGTPCWTGSSFMCLALGSVFFAVGSALAPGQTLTNPLLDIQLGGNSGPSCAVWLNDPVAPGLSSSIHVDQYSFPGVMALQFGCSNPQYAMRGTVAVDISDTTPHKGYYLFDASGDTYGFGNDSYLTYLGNPGYGNLNAPIVGMATTPSGNGYWMAASDGGVFAYGDAGFHGSTGTIHLNQPVVGMTTTSDGGGYWLVAADGGVFSYGDAGYYGSMGGAHLNRAVVGMASTRDGKGYWLVAADGGIFAFGDAAFLGSTGNIHLNQPVVGMTATSDGHGYWFVAADGGIFAYGDAAFHGTAASGPLNQPIVDMLATSDDGGYLLVAADGGVFTYGDMPFYGSLGGQGSSGVVGAAG